MLLPSGTYSLFDIQHQSSGHHSSFSANGYNNVPFGVVDYSSDMTTMEWKSSHEILEAITDPDATTWCLGGQCSFSMGGSWTPEVGDGCAGAIATIAGMTAQQFWSNSACRCVREEDLNNVDVLANGQFDYTVFRPSPTNRWYAFGFSTIWHWGGSGSLTYGGDYDGDGRTEFSIYKPNAGSASILHIRNGAVTTTAFGSSGDTPVPGDYDNPPDGKTDLAVWQSSLGWRYQSSVTGNIHTYSYGLAGDIPVPGDYDGDGVTDYAVFRVSDTKWHLQMSTDGSYWANWSSIAAGDIPVSGDFNGDGKADFAFWRPSTGTWYIWYKGTSTSYTQQWGLTGDIPVPRDIDSDWLTDMVVWRPSNGTWYSISSATGATASYQWGLSGDNPIGR